MGAALRTFVGLGLGLPVVSLVAFQALSRSRDAPMTTTGGQSPTSDGEQGVTGEVSNTERVPALPKADAVRPSATISRPSARLEVPESKQPRQEWSRPDSEPSYWQELERLKSEDPERALSYALAGEEWYSDEGRPAQARRAMIVTLLVDLGRMGEAREKTRAFLERYPKSPYRPLVQGVTGIHPRPGPPPPVH